MFSKEFYILGDGVTRLLKVDLTKAPVGMEFRGENYPKMAMLDMPTDGVKVSTDSGKLYFEFPTTLEKDSLWKHVVTFYY